MFLHDRNFEFENMFLKIWNFHTFLNLTRKCVNSLIPSHFCDFLLKITKKNVRKNMFLQKISIDYNKNELCTKIQNDPNIFVENNGFKIFFWIWIFSKELDLQKRCEKVR